MIGAALADRILDAIAAMLGAGLVERKEGHLPTLVAESLDYIDEWRPGHDPWWDLAHWPALRGRTTTLRSWEHDVASIVPRWEALLHEAGTNPEDRLRLVIGARLEDVETTHLDRNPSLHFSVHWWWGVIDRIDTELHLRRAIRTEDPLAHAELVETTAWDIAGASRASVTPHVNLKGDPDAATASMTLPRTALDHDRASGVNRQVPPASMRSCWDQGAVDVWDGRYRPSPAGPWALSAQQMLQWRAQVQILFPYLEEHRRRIQQEFLPKARQAGIATDTDDAWELGQMFRAVMKNQVRVSLETYEHLKRARNVRNSLAHGKPADRKDLEVLIRLIPL